MSILNSLAIESALGKQTVVKVPRFIISDNLLKLLCDNIIPRKKENQRKLDLDYKAKGDKDKIFKDKLV